MKYSEIKNDIEAIFQGNDFAFISASLQSPTQYSFPEKELHDVISERAFSYISLHKPQLQLEFDVPFPPPTCEEFSFIDLFAGIGGFRIPMQREGGKCLFSSEFNPHAQGLARESSA